MNVEKDRRRSVVIFMGNRFKIFFNRRWTQIDTDGRRDKRKTYRVIR